MRRFCVYLCSLIGVLSLLYTETADLSTSESLATIAVEDPHAMDRLLHFLESCDQAGGIGKVTHTNMRISGIVMQHPLMRKVGKV